MTIGADTLMSLADYERHRNEHRAHLIAHRAARSLHLGPAMRLQFEDELTVRYQIQEVLRAGRVTARAEVEAEIAVYRHLLPGGGEWLATLFIEVPAPAQRRQRLPALSEAAHRIHLDVGGAERVIAAANEDLADRHLWRPSAVHFLRFSLPAPVRAALRRGAPAALGCAHEQYAWRRPLPPRLVARLCGDLHPEPAAARSDFQPA